MEKVAFEERAGTQRSEKEANRAAKGEMIDPPAHRRAGRHSPISQGHTVVENRGGEKVRGEGQGQHGGAEGAHALHRLFVYLPDLNWVQKPGGGVAAHNQKFKMGGTYSIIAARDKNLALFRSTPLLG